MDRPAAGTPVIERTINRLKPYRRTATWRVSQTSFLATVPNAPTAPPAAEGAAPPVRVTLPDGRVHISGHDDVDGALSALFGRTVALATVPPQDPELEEYWPDIDGLAHRDAVTDEAMSSGTFFDLATVHLLTTATLDRLRVLYPQGRFEVRRFRPNVVVDPTGNDEGFAEDGWIGRTLALGDPDVTLNSFIVSNTRYADVATWGHSKEELRAHHVLFQQDDRATYIGTLLGMILSTH